MTTEETGVLRDDGGLLGLGHVPLEGDEPVLARVDEDLVLQAQELQEGLTRRADALEELQEALGEADEMGLGGADDQRAERRAADDEHLDGLDEHGGGATF